MIILIEMKKPLFSGDLNLKKYEANFPPQSNIIQLSLDYLSFAGMFAICNDF